ncbi:hypothetical protein EVAR_73493_1 [Eumeta japonica]|uniref:Uncharacterized protein n=1 Tax=Eumeta variegata TaxID=151549 RepID=A0A4C1SVE2_EUMVA|nr:hypothetical protein EVAR_73493_1 [Eumeta japonica]
MALLTNSLNKNNNNNNKNNNNILANGWNGKTVNNNISNSPDCIWTTAKLPLASAIKNRHKYDKLLPNTTNSTRVYETNEAYDNDDIVPAKNERIDINSTSENDDNNGGGGLNTTTWQAQKLLTTKLTPLATLSTTATSTPTQIQRLKAATTTAATDDLKIVKTSRHMKYKQSYESNKLSGYSHAAAAATTFTNGDISTSSSTDCISNVDVVTPNSYHDSAQKLIKHPHNSKASKMNCTSNKNLSSSRSSSSTKNMHINNSKYFDNVHNDCNQSSGNPILTTYSTETATTPTTAYSCHNFPTYTTSSRCTDSLPTTNSSSSSSLVSAMTTPAVNYLANTQTLQQNSITFGGLLKHQQPQQQHQQHQSPPLASTPLAALQSMKEMSVPALTTAAVTTTALSSSNGINSNYEIVKNVNNLNNTNATNLYSNSITNTTNRHPQLLKQHLRIPRQIPLCTVIIIMIIIVIVVVNICGNHCCRQHPLQQTRPCHHCHLQHRVQIVIAAVI